MRRRRPTVWVVVPEDEGTFELGRRGRPLANRLSKRELLRRLKSQHRPGDKILIEEPDGYQKPIGLSDLT